MYFRQDSISSVLVQLKTSFLIAVRGRQSKRKPLEGFGGDGYTECKDIDECFQGSHTCTGQVGQNLV